MADTPNRAQLVRELRYRLAVECPPAPLRGSWWVRSDTGECVQIVAVAIDQESKVPRARVVYVGADGGYYCVSHEYFHEVIELPVRTASAHPRVAANTTVFGVVALGGKRRRFEKQHP